MKKLGKYGKKVSCVVIGMLCAAAIGACGSTQSGSQDEKDVRNDISVYEEGAELEGTLTYGTLFIEPQTQHMIDLFMKEHPGVKIETKVVFDNDVTDEQYNEGLNTLLTELASDQRADIYDATYLPSEIKTKGSGYFEDGSSAEVGSSNSMTSGFIARARAMAIRCFCPPERLPG